MTDIPRAVEMGEFDVDVNAGTTWYKKITIGLGVWNTQWHAQIFVPNETASYDKLYLRMALHNVATIPVPSPVTIGIYNVDGSNKPNMASPIATITEDGTTLTKNTYPILPECPPKLYTFAAPFTLTAGTKYAIVLSSAQIDHSTQYVLCTIWYSNYTYPTYDSNNGGSTWNLGSPQISMWFGVLKTGCYVKISEETLDRVSEYDDSLKLNNIIVLTMYAVDQINTPSPSTDLYLASEWNWVAQSFIPTVTGPCCSVQVNLLKDVGSTQDSSIYCSIFAANGSGLPIGLALATEEIPPANILEYTPGLYGTMSYTVVFTTPATLTSGNRYAMVFWTLDTSETVYLTAHSPSTYANGVMSESDDDGGSWWAYSTYDILFKTFEGVYGNTGIQTQEFHVEGYQ